MIGLIDLTDLSDGCGPRDIERLCNRARRAGTAAVCVWPDFVAQASQELCDDAVRVATVANFPTGDERAFATGVLVERCLSDGADEIDVVVPHRAFVAGDTARAAQVLEVVRHLADGAGASMKVILETGEVPADRVADVARFAIAAGADFIKTSTGKTPVSATPGAVRVMLEVIAATEHRVGIKPSGGISQFADAEQYLAMAEQVVGSEWVTAETFRFGASRLLDTLEAITPD